MNSRVTGTTKTYAVIGNPISHSLSPEIHNSIFDEKNENNIYIPLKIKESDLGGSVYTLRNNLKGFNVTIPHKQTIINYLDGIDEEAKLYGAVNTVKVEDGKFIGYNTDGYGFTKSLQVEGIGLKGKKVLLLGAGGVARVAAYEILKMGGILTIGNRNRQRANRLKEELTLTTGIEEIEVLGMEELEGGYYCIVNATPVGMHPKVDETPVKENTLQGVEVAYDMIYNPYKTKFLQIAEAKGCKIINGFSMLFYQAVKAQEIWTDKVLESERLKKIYEEVEQYFLGEGDRK